MTIKVGWILVRSNGLKHFENSKLEILRPEV